MLQLDHTQVLSLLPDRKLDSPKGDFGRILLLCGSEGYTGAAALSAMGALRSGAGLVYLGVPRCIYAIEAVKLTEPIVFPLPDEGGTVSVHALKQVLSLLPKMDAVLIGPGLGHSQGVTALVTGVLQEFIGPVVLDADGINAIAPHKDILRGREGVTVLTPHAGEFHRLGGDITGDRLKAATCFAAEFGCILLLKGHDTLITDGKTTYVNPTGNPGMAVGGSGDVLSGMLVSLLGQGMEPLLASACAAYLHGAAGDACARDLGQYGMLPTDMLQILPRLMK